MQAATVGANSLPAWPINSPGNLLTSLQWLWLFHWADCQHQNWDDGETSNRPSSWSRHLQIHRICPGQRFIEPIFTHCWKLRAGAQNKAHKLQRKAIPNEKAEPHDIRHCFQAYQPFYALLHETRESWSTGLRTFPLHRPVIGKAGNQAHRMPKLPFRVTVFMLIIYNDEPSMNGNLNYVLVEKSIFHSEVRSSHGVFEALHMEARIK